MPRTSRVVVAVVVTASLSGCSLVPQRASQGDIAACIYVQNAVADRVLVQAYVDVLGAPSFAEGVEGGSAWVACACLGPGRRS